MPVATDNRQFLLGRWLLTMNGPPIQNGCLVIKDKQIVGVLTQAEYLAYDYPAKTQSTKDYGEAIIMPGLINLHTHLDYSALKHFDTHSRFFKWIRGLIGNSWQWTADQWRQSAAIGAFEIALSGTTCVADASYSGAAAYGLAHIGLRGVVGLELFGIVEEKAEIYWSAWLKKYDEFLASADLILRQALEEKLVTITAAPHTPYTVCPALLRKALDWSRSHQLPLFLHVAESDMECNWIAGSEPDVDEFLYQSTKEEVVGGIGSLSWRGHGLTPVQHLEKHELLADNVLAAHVVKVSEADIAILAKRKLSAVHCPRSNSRLRNGIAPWAKLMKAGLSLGFGTDSSASSDDLNVLNEARFAWNLHRAVDTQFDESSEKALHYLTLGAAQALGLAHLIGSLEPEKLADIAIFGIDRLPESARSNPADCILYGGANLRDLYVNGARIVQEGQLAGRYASVSG